MKTIKAPYKCIFCGQTEKNKFSSVEHIVPESMGNSLLVLPQGWVCNECNNYLSLIEKEVQERSVLGIERCRFGVITKKGKPSKAKTGNLIWEAIPEVKNRIYLTVTQKSESAYYLDQDKATIEIPVHDKSTRYILRLLLKIGLELCAIKYISQFDSMFKPSINILFNKGNDIWKYLLITNGDITSKTKNLFGVDKKAVEELKGQNIELCLHEFDDEIILFFKYGYFFAAVNLSSTSLEYKNEIEKWGCEVIIC
jgi:hypothetical protein